MYYLISSFLEYAICEVIGHNQSTCRKTRKAEICIFIRKCQNRTVSISLNHLISFIIKLVFSTLQLESYSKINYFGESKDTDFWFSPK